MATLYGLSRSSKNVRDAFLGRHPSPEQKERTHRTTASAADSAVVAAADVPRRVLDDDDDRLDLGCVVDFDDVARAGT